MRRPRPPSARQWLAEIPPRAVSPPHGTKPACRPLSAPALRKSSPPCRQRPASAAGRCVQDESGQSASSPISLGRNRQQRLDSPPPLAAPDAAARILSLARTAERGEQVSRSLVLQCLAHVGDLKVNAPGGTSLLWMVAPVLQVARDQLVQANDFRQELEAEVGNLREQAAQLGKDIALKCEELRRAEEASAERAKEHLTKKQELEEAIAQLRREIAQVKSERVDLNYKVTKGLAMERADWEEERRQLEAEIASIDKDIEVKSDLLHQHLPEKQRQLREKIASDEMRLTRLLPGLEAKGVVSIKTDTRRAKCVELQRQLEDLRKEAKKATASRKR